MAIRAEASAVKRRIAKLRTGLFSAAEEATRRTAERTIQRVGNNAIVRTAGEHQRQVGFDMVQFLDNLDGVVRIAPGRYAILDTERMGTLDDLEKIRGVKNLWHFGGGQGMKFEKIVLNIARNRQLVEGGRRAVWGTTTPQWIILENGSSTGDGQPVPPANFIRSVVADEFGILEAWKADIRKSLKSRGIL